MLCTAKFLIDLYSILANQLSVFKTRGMFMKYLVS